MNGKEKTERMELMWKKAIVAYFKVLSQHFPVGTEDNHEKLHQDSRSPSRDLNPGPPEHEPSVRTPFLTNDNKLNLTSRMEIKNFGSLFTPLSTPNCEYIRK
jgi:hypothetical protein